MVDARRMRLGEGRGCVMGSVGRLALRRFARRPRFQKGHFIRGDGADQFKGRSDLIGPRPTLSG